MKLLLPALLTIPCLAAPEGLTPPQGRETARGSYLEPVAAPRQDAITGKVTGVVRFDGERPAARTLDISEEKAKGCTEHGKELDKTDWSLVISKDLGIKNVVVSIAVPEAKVKVPEKPIALDQIACVFEPHVILLPVGATVEYLNSDKISHNVRTLARKHETINKTVAPGGKETQVLDQGADKIEVKCDMHPWMNAWLFVTDTPFAAVSDAEGAFAISGLPPGEYKLTFWHERLPKAEAMVTVRPDGGSDPVAVKMAEKKKKRE